MEETLNPAQPGSISPKIVSIVAGEAHTLALTGDGKVYSWGRGTFGRLGTGSEEDRHFPVQISFFGSDAEREDKLKIVGIAVGAYHSLALADDGSVWGWGYNIYGQIGVTGENHLIPHLLEGFFGLGSPGSSTQDHETGSGKLLKISSVKAGGMMSLAIDDHGALWMWGNCPHPSQNPSSEATFSLVSSPSPLPVWNFHGHTVVKVSCGNEHVIALVTIGETHKGGDLLCYSWGNNSCGQLGLGDKESRLNPEIIENFNVDSPWDVYDIACGASHTALLMKRKESSGSLESFCCTFGLGDHGQLGHGTTQSSSSPEIVRNLPHNVFLLSVGCGLFHTSVVSSDGEIWSWGMENGLGLCPDARFAGTDTGDALLPLLVPRNGLHDHKFQEPMQVACGGAHTVLVTDSGSRIWSWGRGRSGVLGNGKAVDSYEPSLVLWPPLGDDFRKEEEINIEKNFEGSPETEKTKLLESRLLVMERYASVLHGSIFGKPLGDNDIPVSVRDSGTFDIGKEWENMLESLDQRGLARLEMFYRDMRAGVKDKLLKRRVQEMVKESLNSNAARSTE